MKRKTSCLVLNEMVYSFRYKFVNVWNFALFTTGCNKTIIFNYYRMLCIFTPVCQGFVRCLKLAGELEVNYSKPVLTGGMYLL